MPRRKEHSPKSEPSNVKESWRVSATLEKLQSPGTEIVQEHPEDAPSGWAEIQDKLAAESGLSVLLVDGRQPPALVASNNNSICHAFQSSMEYVGLCDPFCGDAHRRALSAGSTVEYKCHAGLQCFTTPVQIAGRQNLAAIGGRAFVSGADYRQLVDRIRAGELNALLTSEFFTNVIFADSMRLEQLSQRLQKAVRLYSSQADTFTDSPSAAVPASKPLAGVSPEPHVRNEAAPVVGNDKEAVSTEDKDLIAAETETDSELRGEVARLVAEVEHRKRIDQYLQNLARRINRGDPDKTYRTIIEVVMESLKAERASLMVLDETSNELTVKAAVGLAIAEEKVGGIRLSEGTAGPVLKSGKARVIENLELAGMSPSPAERNYKTRSFISFPIILEGRRLGVLNVADKSDNGKFNTVDLAILEVIGPRIADALDRAQLQQLSITDPLTGLYNRRYLKERLAEELNRSERYSLDMSCLLIDVDDFKFYNDRNGHLAGDEALRLTARCLKDALRVADVACRYGGEEFCVVLPQTTMAKAGVIAERMRQRVTELSDLHGASQPLGTLSVSIGISAFAKHIETADKVIEAADRALYKAKRGGKNRIEFYIDPLTDPPAAR